MSNLTERDERILLAHKGGEGFAAIARTHGISAERVRQIVRRSGVTPQESRDFRLRDWTCGECGEKHRTLHPRQFCGSACEIKARVATFDPLEAMRYNRHDGHYWLRVPGTSKKMRVERYLAQKREGRELRRDEWVVLLDGDPTNLDLENIVVMTPAEATEHHRRRRGEVAA